MRHIIRLRKFEQGHDRRIAPTLFEAAQVLLAESETRFDVFLREAFFAPKTRKVTPDKRSILLGAVTLTKTPK